MSVPNLNNNLMQQQNIVINQVQMGHAILANVNTNNGMPVVNAIPHTNSTEPIGEVKNNMNMIDNLASQHIGGGQNSSAQNIGAKGSQPNTSSNEPLLVLVTKQRLQDLVRETDPTLNLEEEVEEIILGYVDEFVDRVLNGAALIAKNRKVNTIEVKDVQQFLNRNYNMWTPGFGTDELRPYKRSATTESHKQRIALIRKTLKKY